MSENRLNTSSGESIHVDSKEQSKRVWIVNHYASAPHKSGGGGRHYAMGKWLAQNGWATTLIGSTTVHPSGRQAFDDPKLVRFEKENGVDCLWVWSSSYASGGVARMIGMLSFTIGALLPRTTRNIEPPNVVVGSTVHLLAAWAGWRLARRHGVPFVYEIRDLWPETLIDLGALKAKGLLARWMKKFSLSLAHRASLVLSPLPGVGRYLHENSIPTPFLCVPNGTEDSLGPSPVSDEFVRSDRFTFMYLGSHGRANALDTLLKAFDQVCDLIPDADIVFRLVGSGPAKESLQNFAKDLKHADRIFFEDHIPRSEVNERAMQSDCLVVNLRDRPIYEYGISLNKLYDYMLAARPIVIASSAMNDPVNEARAGITVPADDSGGLAQAMIDIFEMDEHVRRELGMNGREYVLSNYSYQLLALKLGNALDQIL